MKPINLEILLSHSVGISSSYYRPTESDLLEDYLKVSDLLTFDKQEKIQKELKDIEQKGKEENYVIKEKLQEKDEEIKKLNEQYQNEMRTLREEIENKFQQLLIKIDTNKINQ